MDTLVPERPINMLGFFCVWFQSTLGIIYHVQQIVMMNEFNSRNWIVTACWAPLDSSDLFCGAGCQICTTTAPPPPKSTTLSSNFQIFDFHLFSYSILPTLSNQYITVGSVFCIQKQTLNMCSYWSNHRQARDLLIVLYMNVHFYTTDRLLNPTQECTFCIMICCWERKEEQYSQISHIASFNSL